MKKTIESLLMKADLSEGWEYGILTMRKERLSLETKTGYEPVEKAIEEMAIEIFDGKNFHQNGLANAKKNIGKIARIRAKKCKKYEFCVYDQSGYLLMNTCDPLNPEFSTICIDDIPADDCGDFWGWYEYTHGGWKFRKVCEFVSDMKQRGHVFRDGQKVSYTV